MQIFPGLIESSGGTFGQQKTEKKSYSGMFSLVLGSVSAEKTQGKNGHVAQKLQAEIFSRLASKNGFAKSAGKSSEQVGKADGVQKTDLKDEAFVSAMSFFLNLLTRLETPFTGDSVPENGFLKTQKKGESLPKKDVYKEVLAELRLLLRQKGIENSQIQDLLAELEQTGKSVGGKISFGALKEAILMAWKDTLPKEDKGGLGKAVSFEKTKSRSVETKEILMRGPVAQKNASEIIRSKESMDLSASFEKKKNSVTHSDLKIAGRIKEEGQLFKLPATAKQSGAGSVPSGQKAVVSGEGVKEPSSKDTAFVKLEELLGNIKSRLQQALTKSGLEKAEAKVLGEQILADLYQIRLGDSSVKEKKFLQKRVVSLKSVWRFAGQEKDSKFVEPDMRSKADKSLENRLEGKRLKDGQILAARNDFQTRLVRKISPEFDDHPVVTKENLLAAKEEKEFHLSSDGLDFENTKKSGQAGKSDEFVAGEKGNNTKPDIVAEKQRLAVYTTHGDESRNRQANLEPEAVNPKDVYVSNSAPTDLRRKKMLEREQVKETKTEFRLQTKESLTTRNIEDMSSGGFDRGENFSSSRQDMFAHEHGKSEASQPTSANEKSLRLSAQVARQIEQGAFRNIQSGTRQIILQLNPVTLGSVMVMLRVNKDKEVQAVLRAGNHEAAKVIGEQAQQLRQSLEAQGLKVSRLDVEHDASLRSNSDEGGWQQQNRQESESQQGLRDQFSWRNQRKNELETDVSAVLEHELQNTVYQENFSSGVDLFA